MPTSTITVVITLALVALPVTASAWPRRRMARQRPQPPRVQAMELDGQGKPITYTLVETPHWTDGYWTREEWPAEIKFSDSTWKLDAKFRETYPYVLWVWDWPGRKPSDRTWRVEEWKGVTPEKPKKVERIPSYSPYWPGQRNNL